MGKKILLVGTLDSKGREIGYLGQRVEERGWGVIILDTGYWMLAPWAILNAMPIYLSMRWLRLAAKPCLR
jgi:hypothetical protein